MKKAKEKEKEVKTRTYADLDNDYKEGRIDFEEYIRQRSVLTLKLARDEKNRVKIPKDKQISITCDKIDI